MIRTIMVLPCGEFQKSGKIPLQRNSADCGCHALIVLVAENILRRSFKFDFQTNKIIIIVKKWPLAWEIT
jgi:Ulp1 family protease